MSYSFSIFLVLSIIVTLLNFSLQLRSLAAKGAAKSANFEMNNLTLDSYLYGASDEGNLQCLMKVLAKINIDTKIDEKSNTGNFQDDIREGVIQGIDVATMLLQFTHQQKGDREAIFSCNLNLNQAQERCEDVYVTDGCQKVSLRQATGVKTDTDSKFLPYVTRGCPAGYIRLGCCKCVRACDEYKVKHFKLFVIEHFFEYIF